MTRSNFQSDHLHKQSHVKNQKPVSLLLVDWPIHISFTELDFF